MAFSNSFVHWLVFCAGLTVLVFLVNHCQTKIHAQEPFTPYLRQTYRPYVRHARLFGESMFGHVQYTVTKLFRKFGII